MIDLVKVDDPQKSSVAMAVLITLLLSLNILTRKMMMGRFLLNHFANFDHIKHARCQIIFFDCSIGITSTHNKAQLLLKRFNNLQKNL